MVHMIDSHGEPIPRDEVFDVLFRNFPDAYLDVREFTPDEYMKISEPDKVE